MRIFQGQHVGQCDQRAHTFNLLQQGCLGIALLRQSFDALVVLANLLTDGFDARQQWLECSLQLWTQPFGFFWIHIAYVAAAQPLAIGLGQSTCRVDQRRPCSHQSGSRPDHRQIRLRFRAAMFHRTQQLRIDPR